MAKFMANVQHLGRSLMLPIAVLPVAAILLRVGQPDLLNIAFIAAAGDAIFANLGMLFAVGIAVGFAKGNHGAAGLAGLVAYLVAVNGAQILVNVSPEALEGVSDAHKGIVEGAKKVGEIKKLRVPIGIISGLVSGILYNRYYNIRLPEFLAFFGGRRFVPIAAGVCGLFIAALFGYAFPSISAGIDSFSQGVVSAGGFGLFIFGVLNRLLIVTGLHHILNNVAWFVMGDYNGATGDLGRFFAGDKSAGAFMTGFFPVMMFGLPAACYAMYRSALPERRKEVGGMYVSLGLTSLLTGVTEPIEFTFMFLAPLLYAVHAVLTGISMALMDFLNIKLGFGFSAGLFDYVLSFKLGTNPWMLFPVGIAYALIYYFVFRFFIKKFDLQVPGREAVDAEAADDSSALSSGEDSKAHGYIRALGGSDNLNSVSACTTRLRLEVKDNKAVDEAALKRLGARGVIRPSKGALQVVLGPTAELTADEIKAVLASSGQISALSAKPVNAPKPSRTTAITSGTKLDAKAVLAALGGAGNLGSIKSASTRLVITLNDAEAMDEGALTQAGVRGVARLRGGLTHLVIGPDAQALEAEIAALS